MLFAQVLSESFRRESLCDLFHLQSLPSLRLFFRFLDLSCAFRPLSLYPFSASLHRRRRPSSSSKATRARLSSDILTLHVERVVVPRFLLFVNLLTMAVVWSSVSVSSSS